MAATVLPHSAAQFWLLDGQAVVGFSTALIDALTSRYPSTTQNLMIEVAMLDQSHRQERIAWTFDRLQIASCTEQLPFP
jgi:hypothetical protein